MRLLLLFVLLMLFSVGFCKGQPYTIKGSVEDTLNLAKLPQACVTLIRASDSMLQTFARTNDSGYFELKADSAGKYIMMITYPSFADYVDVIKLKDKNMDLGIIPMISRSHLMKEFVLTQQVAAIKIKGDTTEYVADSFKVKDNATVEDLLKKLPGIQVDKNGKVVAQGETVQKILVDGEEFFSDDPAVVTKGLQANAVDKVQVFDKKSEQAQFTGIDDGEKIKTINLELKENKKKGYFGKIDAGGGTGGYFQNQGMVNAFKGKRQLSVFAIASNTDKVGLGWEDKDKYSSTNSTTEVGENGGITMYWSGNSDNFSNWDGRYSGEGFPKIWTGGAHFADKWDEDKEHISGNYRYALQNVEIAGNTITQTPLTTSIQSRAQYSKGQKQAADAVYEWSIDSSSSLKLTMDAEVKNVDANSNYSTSVNNIAGDGLLNTNTRTITSNMVSQNNDVELLYRKKFAKKGRSMSVDLKENYNDTKNNGFLYSNTFFDSSQTSQITDQKKQSDNSNLGLSSKLTYTEPLSKVVFLELNYSLGINNSNALNYSYDKPLGGTVYDVLNDTFSSNYVFNVLTNSGGANMRFVYKKLNFSFGGNVSDARFKQTDQLHNDSTTLRDYINFFPRASLSYKIKKQTSFSLNYSGNSQQPKIDQVQPLRQNTDPLNIAEGNPALKQQFFHNFSARFNDYKALSGRSFWSSINLTVVQDAIASSDYYNGGVHNYQYVNVSGNYNLNGYAGYWYELKKYNMEMGAQIQPQLGHVNSYLNGNKVSSDNGIYTFNLDFKYEKEKKVSISLSPSITYNDNRSTASLYTYSYLTSNNEMDASVELPKKFELGTSVRWSIRQTTPIFTQNNNVFLWNAYACKKFLKNDQLELRFTVYDILNRNIGFNRTAQSGIITQNDYNTIMRYGLINVLWNFTKTPMSVSADTNQNK